MYEAQISGAQVESQVMSDLFRLGYAVFTPFHNTSCIDLIAYNENDYTFLRIEVKARGGVKLSKQQKVHADIVATIAADGIKVIYYNASSWERVYLLAADSPEGFR